MRIDEKLHIYKNNTQTDFDLYSDKEIPGQSKYLNVVTASGEIAYCPISTSKNTANALAIRSGSTTYYTVKVDQILSFVYYCRYDAQSSSCSSSTAEDLYVTEITLNQPLNRDICIEFSSEDGNSKVFTIAAGNLTATISNTYVFTNYRAKSDGEYSFFYEVYYPDVINYATAVIDTLQESITFAAVTFVTVGYKSIDITNPYSEDNTLPEHLYIYTKVNARDWQELGYVKSSTNYMDTTREAMNLILLWYTIKYQYVYNGKIIKTETMSLGPADMGIESPTHTIKIPVETVAEKLPVVSKTAITYTESSTKISKSIEI